MAEKCLVCDEEVVSDLCKVGEKGILGLVKASVLRKDGKDEELKKKKIGVVHGACRKDYTRSDSIKKYLTQNPPSPEPSTSGAPPTLRSSQPAFDFRSKCLFCTEICDAEKQKKYSAAERRVIYNVRTTTFHSTIIARGQARGDEWGADVARRVGTVGDLHAADAVYHKECYRQFMLKSTSSDKGRGRPRDEAICEAMEEIHAYIEGNDSCQFSIDELLEQVTGEPPNLKTVLNRLKETYGDRLVISTLPGRKTVICLRSAGYKILNDAWYADRCADEQSERDRIVKKAAQIILQDIETMAYDINEYPPPENFCSGASDMIPQSLRVFLDYFLKKKRSTESAGTKLTVIAHALIAVIRPRSFISPILNSIALFIYRKFGSKNLVTLLSKLGLSASYHSAQQLELSTMYQPKPPLPKVFSQYVFDNADYNVATIDGWNTFHSMGGIRCVTPASALPPSSNVPRVKSAPTQEVLGQLGVLELQPFQPAATNALQNVTVKDLNTLNPISSDMLSPSIADLLWMSGKWLQDGQHTLEVPKIPEWKGFMQLICKQNTTERTSVTFLPFINAPPSDYSTVYTALQFAHQQSQEDGATVCFVTFDQPLYLKAREIKCGTIAVRLGGFHTLMSFMGCIGQTMAGSGLKEVLSQVFAPNSVDKMLTGHAYSRGVRGHFLVQAVLAQIVLEGANITTVEKRDISTILSNMDEIGPEKLQEPSLLSTLSKLESRLESLTSNGPTASLWVQYFKMITLMKKFIDSERRGDWCGHLACVQQMIPFFHASGHFHYAKCAHIYVQDMLQLKEDQPEAFQQFAEEGCFTINRTGKPWAGVWSDMAIEQTLMRSMKSSGGLTRGRGITDSVLAKWTAGLPGSSAICSSLEEFAGVLFSSGEQHVDFRASRQQRDAQDRAKINEWFIDHPPFPEIKSLVSLSTGLVGNEKINCHEALNIGTATMESFIGTKFGEMKQSRKNTVTRSLGSMSCTIKIGGEKATINPLTIFQRTLITKKSDEDVEALLGYELSPFPLSLFNEGGMRKGTKSTLYNVLPEEENPTVDVTQTTNVVDGGFLLHRVKWRPRSTVASICEQIVTYVIKHYGNRCTVVFDGYGDINSTKKAEQKRRVLLKTSADINFQDATTITIQQEHFLGNEKNKTRLIEFLTRRMSASNIQTMVALGDADTMIVRCGLDRAAENVRVSVIGEDVDLVVLLVALTPTNHSGQLFFLKPGRGNVPSKVYSISRLQQLPFAANILLLHSFSGCDTTSAIYGKSKATAVKCFIDNPTITAEVAEIFYQPSSTPQQIERAGEALFLAIFKAPPHITGLNKLRHYAFVKASLRPNPDLTSLPPTEASALQHSLRVYLQVQQWLGNELPPTTLGWAMRQDGLHPVTTLAPVAPEAVLNAIFCRCTSGCGTRCGCRKTGIACSVACIGCHGACSNAAPTELADEESDEDDDMF